MNNPVFNTEEIFSQLSPADERTLVALPYRIGLFVSYADVTGGWDAQDKELQSLTSILREFSEGFFKTDFAQKVLMDCMLDRGQWASWSKQIDTVPQEAARTVQLLKPMLKDKDLVAFKEVLIEIALAVAMAFREEEIERKDVPPVGAGHVSHILARLTKAEKHSKPLDHINVSANEKAAILRLMDSLQHTRLQRS